MVWGDHNVVIPSQCSYCKTGLNWKCPLGSALTQEKRRSDDSGPIKQAKTTSEQTLVGNAIDASGCGQVIADGLETLLLPENSAFDNHRKGMTTSPGEMEDVLNTEFKDFDLSQDLWQYE